MHAQPGDWLLVEAKSVGHDTRRGQIIEVHGADGAPPFVVRWTDADHESTVIPGPDARVVTEAELAAHDHA
jgi:hypothetical protein